MAKDNKIATKILHGLTKIEGVSLESEGIPLFPTSAFSADSVYEMANIYKEGGYAYVRFHSPNRDLLEEAISIVEDGEKTLCFASGMSAITTTLFTFLAAGDKIICSYHVYGETLAFLEWLEQTYQVSVVFMDVNNLADVESEINERTKLIYTETIGNPTMMVADLPGLAQLANDHQLLLVVDNTFATGIASTPLTCGANLVINSLTKFMNGHSDTIGGSVTGSANLIKKIKKIGPFLGGPLDPQSAWLILRGMLTLDVRMNQQMENANLLAQYLKNIPLVKGVNYPKFSNLSQRALTKIFPNGHYGAMLSFYLEEDVNKINVFMKNLKLVKYAPTLGGLRTTMAHPVTSSHGNVPDLLRREMGITPGLIRISTGCEDISDIIEDFSQAFEKF